MIKKIYLNILSKDFYLKQKEIFISFLKRVIGLIPSVLVGISILLVTVKLYGRENSTIGIVSIFMCALMRQSFTVSNYPVVAFRIFLLGFLATVAEQNIFLIITLNFAVPFFIVFLLSDDFVPRGYFIYGFAYVIFQAYNIPIENIDLRMESIAFALIIVFIFLSLNKIITKKNNNNNNLASKCISIINKKLMLLCNKKYDLKKTDDLFPAINLYTSSIYIDSLKRNSVMSNKNINDFEFVLFVEEINQLIEKEYKNINNLMDNDFEYFSNLHRLLDDIMEFLKNDITKKEKEFNCIINQIRNFNNNYCLSDGNKNYEWLYVLKKLNNILYNMFENRADDLEIEKEFYFRFRIIKKEFNINKCHFRFALKMGIIMCITFTIIYFLPEKIAIRGYWLPILSYIMMYPFYEDVKANLKINLIGNIIGVLIFGAVFRYMPYYMMIPFIGLCIALSLASINILFKKIYGTMSALISSFPYMTKLVSTSSRTGFIVLSLFIVWIFDNFIMKTESHKGMVDKISELIEIDTIIINQMKRAINGERTSNYLYEILLKAYMIKNNIIIHEKNQTKYKGTPITDSLIEANRKFIVEAEQLIYLLKKYNRKEDKNNMLMFIENISFVLEKIAKLFKNEIDDFNSKDLKEPIKTDSYIFYRLQNCFDSINSVNASIKDNMNNIF